MASATMRAAQFGRYGGPEEITLGSAPRPDPAPTEVRVRVRASSVNGGELLFRRGRLRPLSGRRFPKGLGSDLAGVIDAIGDNVAGLAQGDQVWGVVPSIAFVRSQASAGAAAEYVTVPASRVAPMPSDTTFVEAAAMATVATTALTAVRDIAQVSAGQRVLVRGAAGGVGSSVVQLAVARGALVTALAGGAHLDAVRALGATEALDYRAINLAGLARFDVVLDAAGSNLSTVRRLVSPGGRMVAMAMNPPLAGAWSVAASLLHGRERIRFFSGKPDRQLLEQLAVEIAAGNLRPVIDRVHSLDHVADAHRAAQAGGRFGKQVIAVSNGHE